jgi:hypothetical protein
MAGRINYAPLAEQNKYSRTWTMTRPTGFPDFFVVGAPRCGTTSLCRFFDKNPQICFSRPKEPHYFAQLRSMPSPDELQRDYIERYFGHRHGAHRAVGEGSVSYLYAPEAIERIRHFNPEARFIVMVRNPMSMLPSYHLKMRFLLQEDQEDFSSAWRLQEARARGDNLPAHCLEPRTLMYGEVARYGAHIERLFAIAGRERTHVVVFDDFVADQPATYRRALEFLRVDDDGRTVFKRRYESRIYRYRWLQELFFLPVARGARIDTGRRAARKDKQAGPNKPSWIKRLADWNTVSASPRPLTPEMRAVVADGLRADNALLSRLLQRDLSFWLTGATQ